MTEGLAWKSMPDGRRYFQRLKRTEKGEDLKAKFPMLQVKGYALRKEDGGIVADEP